MSMNIQFKHTVGGLKTPKFENGMINLYASEEVIIGPAESKFVKTGTILEVPEGYVLVVTPPPAMSENVPLRYANSVVVIPSGDKEEVALLLENVTPVGARKNLAPEFTHLDGEKITNNYSRGYLPIGTIIVQKNDVIGKAFLLKVESFAVSRAPKKVQEKKNEEE